MRTVSWTTRHQNSRRRPGDCISFPLLPYFIRARDAVHTRVYIWIKYKRKQSLVKHNTLENFSLATDVSAGARFPAAMYVHRIRGYWHSLLGISELASPRLIFRSHCRGNPKWAQPASRHLQALQTRNCPSDSGGIGSPPTHPSSLPRTYIRIHLSLVPGIPSRVSFFTLATYPDRYNSDYPRYCGYSHYPCLLLLPLSSLVTD